MVILVSYTSNLSNIGYLNTYEFGHSSKKWVISLIECYHSGHSPFCMMAYGVGGC